VKQCVSRPATQYAGLAFHSSDLMICESSGHCRWGKHTLTDVLIGQAKFPYVAFAMKKHHDTMRDAKSDGGLHPRSKSPGASASGDGAKRALHIAAPGHAAQPPQPPDAPLRRLRTMRAMIRATPPKSTAATRMVDAYSAKKASMLRPSFLVDVS
jgi:hypothetical protein